VSEPGTEDFDEGRQLCPDGNCLGVVVDGKCNVCGLPAGVEPPAGSPSASMVAEGGHVDELQAEAFDDDRQLCPDGACTGVIGPDGKCKECGRSAAS
jgi:hypothetical protein